MLRTLYLRSKPKSSARNFHWWNYHHSDQLVQNAYISWLVLIRHQISTLQTQTLKTSKLLCYNESHYYQTCKRQKSKRDTRRYNYEEDSEDDDDNLTEEDEDEVFQKYKLYEGDEIATPEPTHRVIYVSSTRVDAVLTKAFGIARAKIEEKLITQNCLVNGKHLKKKSYQAKVGDCIDLIKEKAGSHNTVQRIRVLDIVEGKSRSGNTKVILRLWKKAFPVEIS